MKNSTRDRLLGFAACLLLVAVGIFVGCEGGFLSPSNAAALKEQSAATQARLDDAKAVATAKAADAKAAADAAAAAQAKAVADAVAAAKAAADAAATKDTAGVAAAVAAAEKAARDKAVADSAAASAGAAAAAAAKTLELAASVQASVDKFNSVLAKAVNADGTVNLAGGSQAVGAILPPPWNLIAMIGIPAVVGLIQEGRKRQSDANAAAAQAQADTNEKAARSLVNSIDVAKADPTHGPAIVKAFDEMKDEMHGQLTDDAKKILASEKVV